MYLFNAIGRATHGLWCKVRECCCDERRRSVSDPESLPIRKHRRSTVWDYSALDTGTVDHSHRSLTAKFPLFYRSATAVQLCTLYFIGYVCLGVVGFSFIFEKDWTIVDSIYFSVVTFTTVGYGDLSPSTDGGRLFTIVFALCGVIFLGVVLGILGHHVVETQVEALERVRDGAHDRTIGLFAREDSQEESEHFLKESTVWVDIKDIIILEIPIIALVVLFTALIGSSEDWSFITSAYFSIITSTTIGFGDLHPDTQHMRLICVIFLPLCVAIFGELLSRIAGAYIGRKVRNVERNFLARELTLADLNAMDARHDGMVSMEEFLSFMLVAMQKVDKESIDELRALFHSLDVTNTGILEKKDLVRKTRQKSMKMKRRISVRVYRFDSSFEM